MGALLGARGQILVTQAAADAYVDARGLGYEEARRELTVRLIGAHLIDGECGDGPARYRYRSRADNIDITARVVEEDGLMVVVSINVRGRS